MDKPWLSVVAIAGTLVGIALGGAGSGLLLQNFDESVGFSAEAERVAELLELSEGKVVADVRAGTGRWTVAMASHVGPTGLVYATGGPESPAAIFANIAEAGLDNVSVITRTPGETSRLPENCCDAILIRAVYHHFDRPGLPETFFGNLRGGGLLAIVDYDEGTREFIGGHGIAKREVIGQLQAVGFELYREEEDWPGHAYALVFRKPAP